MPKVTLEEIKILRSKTGVGISACKKALLESNGNIEKAVKVLRKRGQKILASRSDKENKEAFVLAKVNESKTEGVLLALGAETDFVTQSDLFRKKAHLIASAALNARIKDNTQLDQLIIDGQPVNAHLLDLAASLGEKISIVDYRTLSAPLVTSYIHTGNYSGVILGFNSTDLLKDEKLAENMAVQIAVSDILAIHPEDIDPELVAKEKEIIDAQIEQLDKPDFVKKKIADNKLKAFLEQNSLLFQSYFNDEKQKVGDYLKSCATQPKIESYHFINTR